MRISTDIHEVAFRPPGPGSWQINGSHVPRPWPRFQTALYAEQMARGFRQTGRRYGLLVDFEMPFVNGFAYYRLAPVAGPEVAARIAAAEDAFARRIWREDLRRWEEEAKPAAIRAHHTLQAIDPVALDDDSLGEHLDRCRTHLKRMIYQHHWFNGGWMVPLGDFLAHTTEWTGRAPADLLPLLRGHTAQSAGCSAELDELVAAIRRDPRPRTVLSGGLDRLCAHPGPVGKAAGAYLRSVGYRLLDGHDVGGRYALEEPATLLETMRRRLEQAEHDEHGERDDAHATVSRLLAAVRDDVPPAHRDRFDELLTEARLTCRLRDERGIFGDVWAAGIARRVLLEAGRRLAAAGRIERPDHVIEADDDELRSLRSGSGGPIAAELAARADFRASHSAADAPPRLGSDPEPPPALDGLPAAAARAMRAVGVAVGLIFLPSDAPSRARLVRGIGASPGVYAGTARLVLGPADLGRIERGDVLVTQSTSEAFTLLLPLLGAIVTDSGGPLSHPAILAREFGMPAVVGTHDATRRIPDGATVRVDGTTGEVALLG